jgi:pimeloyl-ACP methyl ester carboxylesterase
MAGSGVTIVLVHGACSGGWVWEPLGKELDVRGVGHVEVDLPSMGIGADPNADAHTDSEYLRGVLDGLDGPLVLCGNSYGGVVITEASAGAPNVVRLVYLAAFMPDGDDELASWLLGNCTPEFMTAAVYRDDGFVEANPEVVRKVALQQSTAEVADWVAAHSEPMAMGTGGAPTVTAVGWRDIPSTYIVCTEDRTIYADSQRQWARERATDSVEVPFDHCAQLSHPAEVADILARIAEGSST